MKKLLVVGDSFMKADKRHPGTHWTELADEFEIVNYAFHGLTNALIFQRLLEGLQHNPDLVLIWFTESKRIEFENKKADHLPKFISDCHEHYLTDDQLLLMKQYFVSTPINLLNTKSALYILGALSFLQASNIKFMFSYGMFYESLPSIDAHIQQQLETFSSHHFKEIEMRPNPNLPFKYEKYLMDPAYHTSYEHQVWLNTTICNKFKEL